MGTSALMNLGLKAMAASYAAMQTTGHNIANANVAGYSRQQVQLVTSQGQFTGAGFFGKGVDVASVTRAHDEFLTHAAAAAKSLSAMDASRQSMLSQLEKVFPTGENGLGYTAGLFLNSMVDLASNPGDTATRQTVLARAQDLAAQFSGSSDQFDNIQANVTSDLQSSVAAVNGIVASIAKVNQQIAAMKGLGQPPNDLLDQRDQFVNQLSQYVQVSTVPADDGTLGVFVGGGQRLVLGGQSSNLSVVLDPTDPSRSAVALLDSGNQRVIGADSLGGGSIAGLLKFQNGDLVDARNLVGQMAASIASVVNAQQQLGVNLQQPPGSVPSKPLFATGAPLAVPSSGNAKDAGGQYVGAVALTITDATQLTAANYELKVDGSGAVQLTRLSSPPVTQTITDGQVVDGMRIDFGSAPPQPGDSFLLKPVAQAASGMAALLSDPRDLAAASPLIAATDPANAGTASVASLTMVGAPASPALTARLDFTDDSGNYAWTLLDGSNAVVASGTGTWQPGGTIPANGAPDINGFSLGLSGAPRSGDVITVSPTPASAIASNNGNALALAALRDSAFVGRSALPGGGSAGGATASDAYAAAMSDIGVRVQTAGTAATMSAASAAQAEQARSSVSGVNLDEEAANLIQFQQSYQAAAKVLQIAQSIFETLLQTTGN